MPPIQAAAFTVLLRPGRLKARMRDDRHGQDWIHGQEMGCKMLCMNNMGCMDKISEAWTRDNEWMGWNVWTGDGRHGCERGKNDQHG